MTARPPASGEPPDHRWNGVNGHDCADCPPVSVWKCDVPAHGGLRTDTHGRLVNTPAENLVAGKRLADEIVRGDAAPSGEPSTKAGRRLVEGDAQARFSPAEVKALVLTIEAEAHEDGMLRQLERQQFREARATPPALDELTDAIRNLQRQWSGWPTASPPRGYRGGPPRPPLRGVPRTRQQGRGTTVTTYAVKCATCDGDVAQTDDFRVVCAGCRRSGDDCSCRPPASGEPRE
jgi:hypothetical protein